MISGSLLWIKPLALSVTVRNSIRQVFIAAALEQGNHSTVLDFFPCNVVKTRFSWWNWCLHVDKHFWAPFEFKTLLLMLLCYRCPGLVPSPHPKASYDLPSQEHQAGAETDRQRNREPVDLYEGNKCGFNLCLDSFNVAQKFPLQKHLSKLQPKYFLVGFRIICVTIRNTRNVAGWPDLLSNNLSLLLSTFSARGLNANYFTCLIWNRWVNHICCFTPLVRVTRQR